MASPIVAVQQPLWDDPASATLVYMRTADGGIRIESITETLDRAAASHEFKLVSCPRGLDGERVCCGNPAACTGAMRGRVWLDEGESV